MLDANKLQQAVDQACTQFTSGESGLPPCNSKAITELKGNPVGSAPILSCTACGPTSSNARANVQTFEMDSSAKR